MTSIYLHCSALLIEERSGQDEQDLQDWWSIQSILLILSKSIVSRLAQKFRVKTLCLRNKRGGREEW
ncbi:MAG: hypothetical protein KKD69_02860 [Euryarchaeota archaeon]|nr:hypothetical protein [Euryarchaeota archaeon]MBU4491383.1 hypothetical protein [Euryarchaeota archaeon]MCG2727519.1 hypothetical protein [Candidatus Methanoperedenaceae archaeon]